MKTYIRNLDGLAEYAGLESVTGDEIGYGEKAVIFKDSNCDTLEDFYENADFGTCFEYEGKTLCKIRMGNGDADVVYENEDGDIIQF